MTPPLPEPLCHSAADCSADLACLHGWCSAPASEALVLAVAITPPPDSKLLPQQLPELSLASSNSLRLTLVPSVVVRGVVGSPQEVLTTSIEGDLDLRAPGDLAGFEHRFVTHAVAGLNAEGVGFALPVLPARTYRGTFRPADPSLPRHLFAWTAPDRGAPARHDVVLPSRSEYGKLSGRVLTSDYTPLGGARVVVLTAAREVVAVTTSDEARGRYTVLLPPQVTEFYIRVEPTEITGIFPEFVTQMLKFEVEVPIDLQLPELPKGVVASRVRLRLVRSVDGADVPVVGRSVSLIGLLSSGTVRQGGTTDDTGTLEVDLFPGTYECLVTSPPQSTSQTWYGPLTVTAPEAGKDAAPITLQLAPRVPVQGRIVDAWGRPIRAGTVIFQRRSAWQEGQQLAIASGPFDVTIAADGTYDSLVDPGVYDVIVAPDPLTGAPHSVVRGLDVGATGLTHDIVLPLPTLAHLTIVDPAGTPVPGAAIALYFTRGLEAPQLLATGTADAQGVVDLLVPAAPPVLAP